MDPGSIINRFFQSKRNANSLVELENLLLSDDNETVLANITVAQELFERVIESDMLLEVQDQDAATAKYTSWLNDRYRDIINVLLDYICFDNEEIQTAALNAVLRFIEAEVKHPYKQAEKDHWYFPQHLLEGIVRKLLFSRSNSEYVINCFRDFLAYTDVKVFTLKAILSVGCYSEEVDDEVLRNHYQLLFSVSYPKKFVTGDESSVADVNTLVPKESIAVNSFYHLKEKFFRKQFSTAWTQFLQMKLPVTLYHKVLLVLPKKVLPHFHNPALLTDFFTESYKKGGITSLLSLNGLFYLMQNYNVEYPDFFEKLYALFNDTILSSRFSARFFYLSDLFLSSTHLPAYIVASFIKRLSRLSLTSKTSTNHVIIPFVCNLLIRHPTLKILIHRTEPQEVSEDPFIFEEADPLKSNAMESSLWEIKTLQSHINPDVARKARAINSDLSKMEVDLCDILDTTMHSLYKKERKRSFKEAPLCIDKPSKKINT